MDYWWAEKSTKSLMDSAHVGDMATANIEAVDIYR